MKDYRFGSQDGSKPSYYIFTNTSRSQGEAAFYRYETPLEATALFRYLLAHNPGGTYSMGIHKDGARRADIILRREGVTILTDDFLHTSPWKDDPAVAAAARDASEQLEATWKVDRELTGEPILIPNECESTSYVPWYLEGKTLCPEDPGNARTSILKVDVDGVGWVPLDSAKEMARSSWCGSLGMPMVDRYLVAYQVGNSGFSGSMAISPADYKVLEDRYVALERGREAQPERAGMQNRVGMGSQSLDELKERAGQRAREKNAERSVSRADRLIVPQTEYSV